MKPSGINPQKPGMEPRVDVPAPKDIANILFKPSGYSFTKSYTHFAEAILLGILVMLSISSISEILGRQELQFITAARIKELRAEYVDSSSTSPTPQGEHLAVITGEISVLQEVQTANAILSSTGADSYEGTTPHLRRVLAKARVIALHELTNTNQLSTDKELLEFDLKFDRSFPFVADIWDIPRLLGIARWDSERLLAVLVVFCGAIGAAVSGLRTERYLSFRQLTLGFATGFIVFLSIKGGKYIFLVQIESGGNFLNPYSSALAGLLAGLFSDRAYRLLSNLIDAVTKRIEAAM